MRVRNDYWLEAEPPEEVRRIPSIRTSALDGGVPLGLVWHWTGGPAKNPLYPINLANDIRAYDRTKDRAASWNLLVAKDGRLIQSIPFNMGSWHVGRPGRIQGKLFGNINRGTIGVELENSGRLEKVGDKYYCWPFWKDPLEPNLVADPRWEVAAIRARQVGEQYFDEFPAAQEAAALQLVTALVKRFKWPRGAFEYGHSTFDYPRKEDPGPVWMSEVLPRILDAVFGVAVS